MRKKYESLMIEAEQGNLQSMYEVAKLYDAGILPDSSGFESIRWYKKFWEATEVQAVINNYDEDAPDDDRASIPFELSLRELIIEIGLALGLYYSNSTNLEEACFAYECLSDAWVASRYAWISKEKLNGKTDIDELIKRQIVWLEELGVDLEARYGM